MAAKALFGAPLLGDVPRALFGGPLLGDVTPMRLIYVDEAGTSTREPVTIVVGLVINPDTQWLSTASRVEQVLSAVPSQFRSNFIFHATEIWNDHKFREIWSREDRKKILCDMMSIPYHMGIGISYAAVRRKSDGLRADTGVLAGLSKEKFHHTIAFGFCIAMADYFIRESGITNELATVVAEDVPKMRDQLKNFVSLLRTNAITIPEDATPYSEGNPANLLTRERTLRVQRVIDTVHFAAKKEAYLLQLADACAFGLRRFFSDESEGEDFATAIAGGSSPSCFGNKDADTAVNLGIHFRQPTRYMNAKFTFG
jgi:Protein of unknown function (DUF3800)